MAQTTHESAGENLKAQARGAADDLQSEVRKTGETLSHEVSDLAHAARDRLETEAATRKDQIADRIKGVAERVHQSAESFRKDESWLADWVDEGARRLHSASEDIRHRDVHSILDWVNSVSRRQPALVMGVSVAAGFALTRLAKVSAEQGMGSMERNHMTNDRDNERRPESWRWKERPDQPRTGMPKDQGYEEALEGRYGVAKNEGPGTKPAHSESLTEADKHLGGPR